MWLQYYTSPSRETLDFTQPKFLAKFVTLASLQHNMQLADA